MKALRERGFAAVLSGAGPSVLVLGRPADLFRLAEFDAAGFLLRPSSVGRAAETVVIFSMNSAAALSLLRQSVW